MAYSADGLYNYAVYGNCDGENSNAFCVFNAVIGDRNSIALSDIPLDEYPSIGPESAPVHIVEFGCFQCPYTKAAEDNIQEILEKYPNKVRHTFVYAPVPSHHNAFLAAEAAVCAGNEGKFTEYRQLLFENMDYIEISDAAGALRILKSLAEDLGINPKDFEAYLKAFRYGMPPHGGFGFGIERFLMELLDIKNIRECILFPRDRTRLTP